MTRGTLVAVLVFAALLAGVLVIMREKPERGITRISFADVDADAVTRIVTDGKHEVELVKEGDRWRLADGKRADGAAVTRLVQAIPSVASADVVTRNPERFAELEVDEETGTRLQAFVGDQEVARFTVGKQGRGGTYVRTDGAVYAVKGVYASAFARPASAWVQKKLFEIPTADVTRVELKPTAAAAYALVKEEGGWALEDPSILPAGFRFDATAAGRLANAAINVRAKDVLDADPGVETTGLGDAADQVTLVLAGGDALTLRLGSTGDDAAVYARAAGWDEVVTLPAYSARQLRQAVTGLRDLTLMDFDPQQVTRLELQDGERTLVFARDDDSWRVESATEDEPDDFTLDPMKVRNRVQMLTSLRALALASADPSSELAEPAALAKVTLDDGNSATLAFGAATKHEEQDALFARGNADDRVYMVAETTRDRVLGGLASFQKTQEASGLGNIDPATLSNLPPEVREALMKQMADEQRRQRLLESIEGGSGK